MLDLLRRRQRRLQRPHVLGENQAAQRELIAPEIGNRDRATQDRRARRLEPGAIDQPDVDVVLARRQRQRSLDRRGLAAARVSGLDEEILLERKQQRIELARFRLALRLLRRALLLLEILLLQRQRRPMPPRPPLSPGGVDAPARPASGISPTPTYIVSACRGITSRLCSSQSRRDERSLDDRVPSCRETARTYIAVDLNSATAVVNVNGT